MTNHNRTYCVHKVQLYPNFTQVFAQSRRRQWHCFPSSQQQYFCRIYTEVKQWQRNFAKLYSPGFGTTASNISKCSLVQPSQRFSGTSHRKTFPSKKMQADGSMSPSARSIPAGVIELTWTGGGLSDARIFVNADGVRESRSIGALWKARRPAWRRIGLERGSNRDSIVVENGKVALFELLWVAQIGARRVFYLFKLKLKPLACFIYFQSLWATFVVRVERISSVIFISTVIYA